MDAQACRDFASICLIHDSMEGLGPYFSGVADRHHFDNALLCVVQQWQVWLKYLRLDIQDLEHLPKDEQDELTKHLSRIEGILHEVLVEFQSSSDR